MPAGRQRNEMTIAVLICLQIFAKWANSLSIYLSLFLSLSLSLANRIRENKEEERVVFEFESVKYKIK